MADTPETGFGESPFARVPEEIIARLHRGENPDIDAYIAKHPELADLLKELAPAMSVIMRPGDESEVSAGVALGDYRIRREIGRGAMGVVYEAVQLSLNRPVALKVLPFAAVLDPKRLQRFRNEAQAAGQLHHPNIVPVYAVGCERGVHYYAMQMINGLSLAEIIAELRADDPDSGRAETVTHAGSGSTEAVAPKPPRPRYAAPSPLSSQGSTNERPFFDTAARLGVQAARALDHAHSLGILHRDIKPSNLLIDLAGNLWVSDFGLARMADSNDLTHTGEVVGTYAYMSPEVTRGTPADQRSDVYSLGASLYELLTQHKVFSTNDRAQLIQKIANDEPRSPRQLNPSIPVDLETIVLKALAKDSADRYMTAGALADDIERFLAEEPITARRPSLADRTLKWARRHRTLVAATALLLLLTTIGSVAFTAIVLREQANTAAALKDAETNLLLAQQAEKRERLAAKKARKSEQTARRAVDEMYSQFAARWLAEQPNLTEMEKEFVDKALAFYEKMAKENPEDFDARLSKAQATLRAGNIHFKMGRYEPAEKHLLDAITQLKVLAKQAPDNGILASDLVEAQQILGLLLGRTGRTEAGIQVLERTLASFASLTLASVKDQRRDQWFTVRANLANHYERVDRHADSERLLNEVKEEIEVLVSEKEDDLFLRYILAQTYLNSATATNSRAEPAKSPALLKKAASHIEYLLARKPRSRVYRETDRYRIRTSAVTKTQLGDFNSAEADCRKSLDVSKGLAQEFPLVAEYRKIQSQDHALLSVTLLRLRRLRPAYDEGNLAIGILKGLCEETPTVTGYRYALAYSLCQNGTIAGGLSLEDEAVACFTESIKLQRMVVDQEPDLAAHREHLAVFLRDYAWYLAFCPKPDYRDPEKSRELCEEVISIDRDNAVARLVQAVAWYRSEQWERAIKAAEEALRLKEEGRRFAHSDLARLFRAMSLAKLGRLADSQEELSLARELVEGRTPPDPYSRQLVKDATELLESESSRIAENETGTPPD